jgi:hypothetical protein
MKTKKIELDVDFIGGQGPLNLEEEKALSEFFKQRKLTLNKPSGNKGQKKVKSQNVTV